LEKNNPEKLFFVGVPQLFSCKKKVGKKEHTPFVEKTSEKFRDPISA